MACLLITITKRHVHITTKGGYITTIVGILPWSPETCKAFQNKVLFTWLPSCPRNFCYQKKIDCIDHALVASVSSGILVNSGHLLENLVFTALRRATPEIHYFRTRGGREVDFIA